MDTSDEEDVCMGPISLNDIRKALGVMENYKWVVINKCTFF